MMNSSREWNFPAVMTAKRLLMKYLRLEYVGWGGSGEGFVCVFW